MRIRNCSKKLRVDENSVLLGRGDDLNKKTEKTEKAVSKQIR